MSQLPATAPAEPVALAVGDQSPVVETAPINRTQLVMYAGASGDFNPMHHDEEFAKAAGMPSVFAHGMLQAGTLGSLVARWLGLANLRSYGVRFTGQVWPGDVLTMRGTVDSIDDQGGERVASCSFIVARQDGDEVIRASATARVA